MKPYLTNRLKTYVPDKGFRRVNGLDILIETDVYQKIASTHILLESMQEKNRELNRILYHWNEMINILEEISKDIKEIEKGNVSFVPMFPAEHFRI